MFAIMMKRVSLKTAKLIDTTATNLFDRLKMDIRSSTEMFVNQIYDKHEKNLMIIVTPFLNQVARVNNLKSKILGFHTKSIIIN